MGDHHNTPAQFCRVGQRRKNARAHIIDPPVRLARWTGEDRKSRVAIIGRDLPRDVLLESIEVLKIRRAMQVI